MSNLYKAMAEAFPDIEGAVKDKSNPFFKSKYADLASVINAIKPALASRGLWFLQKVHEKTGFACVETIICHESGESVSCGITTVPVAERVTKDKAGIVISVLPGDAQAYGSALTYCRRYSLSAAFSVPQEDDDGNKASDKKAKIEEPKTPQRIAPLSLDEMTMFARDTANRLMEMKDKSYIVDYGLFQEYLTNWERHLDGKAFIREAVETWLKNPDKFMAQYENWRKKQEAKNVEVKSA